jgi:hypothetical protein
VTAPAACAPRSPAVMHASDDRSRMRLSRLPQTHAGPPGNHDVEPPNPTCARLIWKTACDYKCERVLFRCAQTWYVGARGWCVGIDGARVYDFCWNRGERVRGAPFLCARGRGAVSRRRQIHGPQAPARLEGNRESALGDLEASWWKAEETAPARRLRYGLPPHGSKAAASPRTDTTAEAVAYKRARPLNRPDESVGCMRKSTNEAAEPAAMVAHVACGKTAPAKRLRFGLRQQGSAATPRLERGVSLRSTPRYWLAHLRCAQGKTGRRGRHRRDA